MKKIFILALGLIGFLPFTSSAQERIADDPEMIIGKLDNGLTYYIRHNEKPAGCADFYIIHNVGALQEEDNQNGLAHFLEHMAFNGTKHYPEQSMLDFLAKEGVRFGANVNAYTSRTETVYNLSKIPLVRESFVDSVMVILHDWSCNISCENDALDDERGVISEEWRRRDEPRTRMYFAQQELTYKGAKHVERSVLGTLEVINGFKREEILDFYDKWYRPDLQAIVIVGDFDAAKMEEKVRKIYSDIPPQENPVPKEEYKVPVLEEPLFANMLDPQIKYYTLKVIHKTPFPERELRNTEEMFRDMYSRQIVSGIIEERMRRDSKKAESPVSSSVVVTNPSSTDFYTSLFTISPKKESLMEDALRFYAEEIETLVRFGFTEDEFESAKFKLYKRYKFNNEFFASEVTNEEIVNVCKEHFLRGFACAFPYDYREAQKAVLNGLTYEDVEGFEKKMFEDSEKIYSYCANTGKKDIIPPAERMKEILAEAKAADLKPDYMTYEKLDLNINPEAGTVVKTAPVKGIDAEVWTLSNGVKVYFTPSSPVKSHNHLAMSVIFDTGFKTLDQTRVSESRAAISYIERNLSFKGNSRNVIANSPECAGVSIRPSIDRDDASITVLSDSKSLETSFKMLHSTLTEPYFDTDAVLKKFKQDNLRNLKNEEKSHDKFREEYRKARYGDNPWRVKLDSSHIEALDMDLVEDVFRNSFGKIEGTEVYITSDLEKDEIRTMVEKYIASLEGEEVRKDASETYPSTPVYTGRTEIKKEYPLETVPKSTVDYFFKTKMKMTQKNLIISDVLDYILSARYRVQIREVRGGTYTIGFYSELIHRDGVLESQITFQTRPEILDVLLQDIEDGMVKISTENVTEEEMDAAKRYLTKYHHEKEAVRSNDLSVRNNRTYMYVKYGIEPDPDYDKIMGDITAKDIRKLAEKLAKGDRFETVYTEK